MARFVARRALYTVALIFFASLALFPAKLAIEHLGFLRGILQGDFGSSQSSGLPVLTTIAHGASYTLVLGLAAFVLTYLALLLVLVVIVLNPLADIGHQFAAPRFREHVQTA